MADTMRYVYNDAGGNAAGYKDMPAIARSGDRHHLWQWREVESLPSGLPWAREAWFGRYPRQKYSPKRVYS